MLRAAREQRALDLEDVAAQTHVRPALLQALEEGRYDLLPGPVYVRGFLKLYARAVGLDPRTVVEAWEREVGVPPRTPTSPPPRPGPARRARAWWLPDPVLRAMDPRQRLRSAALGTLVVVLAAVAGAWGLSALTRGPAREAPRLASLEDAGQAPFPAPAPEAVPEAAPGGAAPGLPAGETPGDAAPVEAAASPKEPAAQAAPWGEPAPAQPQVRPEPAPAAAAPAPAQPESGAPQTPGAGAARVEVVATVHERVWMAVFADQQPVFSGVADPGRTFTWRARSIISMKLDPAEGVELSVNGRPIGRAGQGVTTLYFGPGEDGRR